MSAQQPPSAAGEVPAAASGDADGDAAAAELPVYDEALHRAAFQAKVQQRFSETMLVERQSLTLAEVKLLTSIVDGVVPTRSRRRRTAGWADGREAMHTRNNLLRNDRT